MFSTLNIKRPLTDEDLSGVGKETNDFFLENQLFLQKKFCAPQFVTAAAEISPG